jgi:hypothetical protein
MDFKAKQQIIESIDSEVEYTHGPNEKGADFGLTRFDPALSTCSYVGVVAKVGKIQQDISEIERQLMNAC